MPLNRSPTRPHPSGKLGAVTRKKNEISNLLNDVPSNLVLIRTLYSEYLSKVEALYEKCQGEWGSWLDCRMAEIEEFKTKIELLICPVPLQDSTWVMSESVRPRTTIVNESFLDNFAK